MNAPPVARSGHTSEREAQRAGRGDRERLFYYITVYQHIIIKVSSIGYTKFNDSFRALSGHIWDDSHSLDIRFYPYLALREIRPQGLRGPGCGVRKDRAHSEQIFVGCRIISGQW